MTSATDHGADDSIRAPAPHPHRILSLLVVVGVLAAAAALAVGVVDLTTSADREGLSEDIVPALVPRDQLASVPAGEVNVAVAPVVPPASGRTTQAIVEVDLEVVERISMIDPTTGVETETWGFRLPNGPDGLIVGTPGPVIRARVGDALRFTITNPPTNHQPHNVDFHAVTGPGGGATATRVAPGESKTIEARLLYPGFFMYHCAHGDIPAHVSHGMFGGILVDPETPLPEVDHEWYVVQSEYYTAGTGPGAVEFDRTAVTDENPAFVVFNGAVGSLTGENALRMRVGERARIYFINAGLNLNSNFHAIGSHWDKVYQEAALLNSPLRGSQTTLIPAGGGTVVELVGRVPSTIVLVDHALSRAVDKGAIGQIVVGGEADPGIFNDLTGGSGAAEGHDTTSTTGGSTPAVDVSIVNGSWRTQEMAATDEFAATEDPADYSVNSLTIRVGTTVTWTNRDQGQIHTVTDVDGAFDSGYFGAGGTFSHTFTAAGEFEYFCLPHPWMRAEVVVEP